MGISSLAACHISLFSLSHRLFAIFFLSLEVAPEIDTNPTSFYRGRVRGVGPVKVRT